jgi:hypothetical protein
MKIQRQITSILSTMVIAGTFLAPPLRAQQGTSQQPAQQTPETTQQPQQQNQPATAPAAQPNSAPANSQAVPAGQNQQNQPQQNQPQQNQSQQNPPQQPANPGGTSVNPSQPPLAPITTYPDASGTQQQQQPSATTPAQTNAPEGPQPKKQQSEPVGAATAESVPTAGGAAAKPAGVAIAPAKQHQTRSWLIKIGAVVAAGAAVGTVYALSRGTPSTPPGATSPGAVPRFGTVPRSGAIHK